MDTVEESTVSYDIVKRCSLEFKCGRQSYEKDQVSRASTTITT